MNEEPADRVSLSDPSAIDEEPRWAPDGGVLLVTSASAPQAPRRLWLVDAKTHERRALTDGVGAAHSAAWSPTADAVCFVGEVPTSDLDLDAETAWFAAHPEAARPTPLRRLTSLRWRSDGTGLARHRQQLFLQPIGSGAPIADGGPIATGGPIPLSPGAWNDSAPAWSPDGRSVAFVSDRGNDPRVVSERNLWIIDVASGAVRQLTTGYWLDGPLAWSPDGTTIACLGLRGLHVPLAIRLWLVAVDGSGAIAGSPGIGAHLWPGGAPVWTASGQRVMIAGGVGETGALLAYDRESRATSVLLQAEATFALLQLRADGVSFVAAASTPAAPSLLVRGSLAGGELEPLLDVNAEWLADIETAPMRKVHFTTADGVRVGGWLVTPLDAKAPYPCVLDVHYGPNAAWGPAFAFGAQAAAGRGIATLMLNPRGSTGYGDEFAAAADYGGNDFADLQTGLDALIADNVIDGERVAIMGLSYGGFMASWAITQTPRFRAAVSINGIANQLTWYLLSDTGSFFYKHQFGDPFADAATMEGYWRHSPIARAANITTPLLLVQSEHDYRCPIDQGEQLFGALVAQGKTVEMIRVPDASHLLMSTASPVHAYLVQREILAWLQRYLR